MMCPGAHRQQRSENRASSKTMGYRKVRFPTSLTALAEHGEPVGAAIFPGFRTGGCVGG